MMAQAAGVDVDKIMNGLQDDLELRKKIYAYTRTLATMQQKMGIDADGNFTGMEESEEGGFGGGGFGEEGFGFGEEEGFGGGEELEAPAGEEGFGASTEKGRFKTEPKKKQRLVIAGAEREDPAYRRLGSTSVMDLLEKLPLWDEDDTALGVYKRHAANILHAIADSDPTPRGRTEIAVKLYKTLRKEGYSNVQAQMVEYMAIRLGYIPPVELDTNMYSLLSKHVTSRANGNGLTRSITDELVAITKLARLARGEGAVKAPGRETWKKLIGGSVHERNLPHNRILSGFTGE
jgi:hypothetical protein